MKRFFKRGLAILLIAIILVSSIYIGSFAAVSAPSANTGIRDQVCTTFDGTNALSYYTGEYTYDNLSALSASALLSELRSLMTDTHKKQSSYDNCRDYSVYTDCEGGDSSKLTTIYTSYSASYSQYNSGQGWNREHVWPKSLGGFDTSGGGSDLHHIRPSESTPNSTRSNRLYGNIDGGTAVYGNLSGALAGYYGGNNLYEPLDNVKGDVARICLYVYVRWGASYSGTGDITNVFESVDTLLEWCALDPVDTWEMERNDVVEEVQGNRNVFIDYPELAWQLFGRSVPDNLTSPSDEIANQPGTDTGSGDGADSGDSDENGDTGADSGAGSEGNVGETITSAPNTDTKYKLVATLDDGSVYYVGKTISSKRFTAVTDAADAAVFGVEASANEGEYILYFYDSGNAKKYIVIADEAGGFSTEDSASGATVLKWSADIETLVVVDSSNNRAFGTSNGSNFSSYAASNSYAWAKLAPLSQDGSGDDNTQVPIYPNPDDEIGEDTGAGGTDVPNEVVFELGANGSASHSDGSTATEYTETVGDYTLNITNGTKLYKNARDASGNSALKLGASGSAGSFSFTVPNGINAVIIKVAGYKANTAKLSVNGTSYTISTLSNNGSYTDITVDTSEAKTVSISTSSGGYRAMINSITFVTGAGSGGGDSCADGTHNANEYGYCRTCQAAIRTATLVIAEDLSLRYGVEIVDESLLEIGAPMMKFIFGGCAYEVTEYTISNGRYVFAFDGIAPDEMTVLIDAEFYLGDEIVEGYCGYSVEANLISVRTDNSSDTALVQLINDTLLYGRAAQNYTGTNGSDLAGDGVENLTASASVPSASDEKTITGNTDSSVRVSSVGVHFNCVNSIFVNVYIADTSLFGNITVGDRSYTLADLKAIDNGEYRLDLDPVGPTQFGNYVTITLKGVDSAEYASVKYSIDSYAYAMLNGGSAEDSAMYELALALYRYGKSSVAYCLANTEA